MTRLFGAFREWLIEVFGFVPREDYGMIQGRMLSMDTEIERLHKERGDLMDSMYERKYQPFEALADAQLETRQIDDVVVQSVRLAWSVEIPHSRFYTVFDPEKELEGVKHHVLTRLTDAFYRHIKRQIFKTP